MLKVLLTTLVLTATLAIGQNESQQEGSRAELPNQIDDKKWIIGVIFMMNGSLMAFLGTKCYH